MLARVARGYLQAGGWLGRARAAAHGVATGFFARALSLEEQGQVSIAIYQAAAGRRPARALAAWEIAWFERRLPAPPARILVAAAGEGPEVRHLVERGHRVDAFEPAPGAALRCRGVIGAGEVHVARYEDLTRAILDGEGNGAAPLRGRRYDAILLGWGSLSHVLDADERRRVLAACTLLSPSGPILASFLTSEANRALDLGASAGRLLAAPVAHLRHQSSAPPAEATAFGAWFGFIHLFAPFEMRQLADSVGRRLLDDDATSYPHATLV